MDILTETQNFLQRFQQGGAFRVYLRERLVAVIPALAIFLLYSVATTAGMVITLGGTRSFLVFVGLIGAPVVLLGSPTSWSSSSSSGWKTAPLRTRRTASQARQSRI